MRWSSGYDDGRSSRQGSPRWRRGAARGDNPEVYRYRSGGVVLPRDADWLEATKGLRQAFVEHAPEGIVAPAISTGG
jgi:hypothetical protein